MINSIHKSVSWGETLRHEYIKLPSADSHKNTDINTQYCNFMMDISTF